MWGILILSTLSLLLINDWLILFLTLAFSLFLCCQKSFNSVYVGLFAKENFFVDNLSLLLVWLSLFITLVVTLKMPSYSLFKNSFYLFLVSLSKLVVIIFFASKSLIVFWLMFELMVIPSFFLILGWGSNPERLLASLYLFVYTMVGSIPLLINILSKKSFSLKYLDVFFFKNLSCTKVLVGFFWVFAFFVKLPVFGLHLWLPKAHVEAPSSGSIILAAIILKMGAYGLFRLNILSLKKILFEVFFYWGMFSIVMVGFMCVSSQDMKVMMAYSSVNHMMFMFLGLFYLSLKKVFFLLLVCVSHGFVSSSLFGLVGSFYKFTHSRKVFLNRGFLKILPILSFFLFIFLMSNCSVPTSLALFCEMLVSKTMILLSFYSMFAIFIYVFLSGLYCIFLYTVLCHGPYSIEYSHANAEILDFSLFFIQLLPVFFLMFFLSFIK